MVNSLSCIHGTATCWCFKVMLLGMYHHLVDKREFTELQGSCLIPMMACCESL